MNLCAILISFSAIIITQKINLIQSLHVSGIWSPSIDMMKVIARFGIQKSDKNHPDETNGYVFGNVTLFKHHEEKKLKRAILALVDRNMFMEINQIYMEHNKDSSMNRSSLCARIFRIIDKVAFDERCNDDKQMDLIRYVPCGKDRFCDGAIGTNNFVADYQFTFVIDNVVQPTFYFLLLLACYREIEPDISTGATSRNISCQWHEGSQDTSVLKYDVWLVNGHPNSASNKLLDLDHQFSFEQQDILLYLGLVICYTVLTTAQLYAFNSQKIKSLLTYLFTISLAVHCLAFYFFALHKIVFAHDGEGFSTLETTADVIRILSVAIFILFILIIAKGWPVTRSDVSGKPFLFIIWILYFVIEIFLFAWTKHSVNTIKEIDEYHTYPGWLSLGFRISLMLWFLYELRSTMMVEQEHKRLKFYLHFGAGIMVWFVHLPLVVMVALQIELMWRSKLILWFSSGADFLAYAIVTHLMWPTRSHHFLAHQTELDYTDELEYYDDNNSQTESYHYNNTQMNGLNHSHHQNSNGYAYDNQILSTGEPIKA